MPSVEAVLKTARRKEKKAAEHHAEQKARRESGNQGSSVKHQETRSKSPSSSRERSNKGKKSTTGAGITRKALKSLKASPKGASAGKKKKD
jgi:hypothetical protein